MTTDSDDSDWRETLQRRLRTEPGFIYGRKAKRARKKELKSDRRIVSAGDNGSQSRRFAGTSE